VSRAAFIGLSASPFFSVSPSESPTNIFASLALPPLLPYSQKTAFSAQIFPLKALARSADVGKKIIVARVLWRFFY
jgi:hypothetical protein